MRINIGKVINERKEVLEIYSRIYRRAVVCAPLYYNNILLALARSLSFAGSFFIFMKLRATS